MAVDFSGKWKLDNSRMENFNKFMEAMGRPAAEVQAMSKADIIEEITQTANGFIIKTTTPKGSMEHEHIIGKETEFITPSGMKAKGCPVWEGSKLVVKLSGEEGKKVTVIKELINGEVVNGMETSTGVKCKQYFIKM